MEVKPEADKYTIRPSSVYSCEGGIEVDLFHTYCGVKLFPLNPLQFPLIPSKPNEALECCKHYATDLFSDLFFRPYLFQLLHYIVCSMLLKIYF